MRGLRKPGIAERHPRSPRCAAMAVGSVPYTDPNAALRLVLESTPEIPTWPQLPRRAFQENMYVQFSEGLPGVVVQPDSLRIFVQNEVPPDELTDFLEKLEAGDPAAFAVSPSYAAALPLLGEALRSLPAPPFVKGQITGPVSFGLAVPFEDRRAILYDDTLREVAVKLLAMKARWQSDLLTGWAADSIPLIMVDEPSLTQVGSAFISIPASIAFPALEECLGQIEGLAGIHVCGGTDWQRMAEMPLDVLNFDAADHLGSLLAHREAVAAFVGEGGLLAWGAVPNDPRALESTPEAIGTLILGGAEQLAETGGLTVDQVLNASFVAPACGTGSLEAALAERCFALTAGASRWLRARL